MRTIKRNFILSLFFALSFNYLGNFAFAESSLLEPASTIKIQNEVNKNSNSNYFDLANIVDNLINNETKKDEAVTDKKDSYRDDFISITSKFNQGNVAVAYDEYNRLIDEIDNDTSLFAISKILYEIGFFTLGDKAINKIIYKNQFSNIINDIKNSYMPKAKLDKNDEIFLAKLYSGIFYDNSAQEVLSELSIFRDKFRDNDFAKYQKARAHFELKEYNNALSTINKALSINPNNISYQVFKINTLIALKKYKDAYKIIEKIENAHSTITYAQEIEILKQTILFHLTKNEKEKKYYLANKIFLEGNLEKAKKDCQNILNFDKNNDKIMALYAKSELALKNIERANVFFVNAYKENKKNLDTLIGLGDIRYLHGDYKNSVKMYKKAYKQDKTNYEIILKLSNAERQYAKDVKDIQKLEQILDKMPKSDYLSYYKGAISIAQKNDVLKEDFLERALTINPTDEKVIGELIELHLKHKNFKLAKGLIDNASFTLQKNYYYYYLCGIYNEATNQNKEAIYFYKTSLNLNPNFEVANSRLLKLIPSDISEEI